MPQESKSPVASAQDSKNTLLYTPAVTGRYRRYDVPTALKDDIQKFQDSLKKSSVLFESTRLLYSDEEKYNEEEDLQDHVKPDEEKVKKYSEYIQGLDSIFKSTLDVSLKSQALKEAVKSTVDYADRNTVPDTDITIENVDEMTQAKPLNNVLVENYTEAVSRIESLPQSQKFSPGYVSQPYTKFRQSIYAVNHGADEEMPPVESYYDDYDEDDNDLIESRAVVSYKCPLTKQYFEDPVTSTQCNHSFSRAAIMEVISKNKFSPGLKCPVSACQYKCRKEFFKSDPDLEARANARKQREIKISQRRDDNIETL